MDEDKGNGSVSWPTAMVAIALVVLVRTITVAAILKYPSVKEALEIWGALTALVGVLTGAFVTYFFTQGTVAAVQQQRNQAEERAQEAESMLPIWQGSFTPTRGGICVISR